MNKLPAAKRVQILAMLCEGSSMRSITRVANVSINTVSKILEDAGEACVEAHDRLVRGVKASRVQCDEIWSFCYAKQKNVPTAKAAPAGAGDLWTWLAGHKWDHGLGAKEMSWSGIVNALGGIILVSAICLGIILVELFGGNHGYIP
jgi:hypothetical protein